MKKYLKFFSAAVLMASMVVMSACSDEEGGGVSKEIPAARIKTLSINNDSWEFFYDDKDRLTGATNINSDGETQITYNYSVAGKLTELESGPWGDYETVFDLDSKGRIVKQYRNDPAEYNTFAYNEDGYLVEYIEMRASGVTFKETATVVDGNITAHTRYGDGKTISRTKNFTYLTNATAVNVSNLPQANLINNERKSVSGFYGKGSRKLVNFLELNYEGAPEKYQKNTNTYTFNNDNQVLTITRSGRDANNQDTGLNEVFTYTYFPITQ